MAGAYTDAVIRLMLGQAQTQANAQRQAAAIMANRDVDIAKANAANTMASADVWGKLPMQLAGIATSAYNQYQEDRRAKETARVADERNRIAAAKEANEDARLKATEQRDRDAAAAKRREDAMKTLPDAAPAYSGFLRQGSRSPEDYVKSLPGIQQAARHGIEAGVLPPTTVAPPPDQWTPELGQQLATIADGLDKAFAKKDPRFMGAGSGVFDTQTQTFIQPPPTPDTAKEYPWTLHQGIVDGKPGSVLVSGDPKNPQIVDAITKQPVKSFQSNPTATQINVGNREAVESKFDSLMEDTPEGKPNAALQAMLDGRQSVDKVVMGTAGRVDPTQKFRLITKLQALEPNFSEQRYQLRQKFDVSGLEHNRIMALDTMAKHLGLVKDLAAALESKNVPLINQILNIGKTQFGWSNAMSADMASTALGTEIASALKGSNAAATDPEINKWVSTLPTSQSPTQWKNNLKTGADIVVGRGQALQETWQRVFGPDNYYPVFSKKSQEYLRGVGSDPSVAVGPGAAASLPQAKPPANPKVGDKWDSPTGPMVMRMGDPKRGEKTGLGWFPR